MQEFRNKVAVVTGGGSGVGAGISRLLGKAGMLVAVADIEFDRAGELAEEIRQSGGEATAFQVDIAAAESMAALAAEVQQTLGDCQLLCANAGVLVPGLLAERTRQDWDWAIAVNIMGTINSVDSFLPQLQHHPQDAQILITNSMSGLLAAGSGKGVYNVTKHAQMAYGETLRVELEDQGIGVSMLLPAGTVSNIMDSGRNRPKALGENKLSDRDIEAIVKAVGGDIVDQRISPDEAVKDLLPAIRRNQTWILTQKTSHLKMVRERFNQILAVIDATEG